MIAECGCAGEEFTVSERDPIGRSTTGFQFRCFVLLGVVALYEAGGDFRLGGDLVGLARS